MGSGETFGDGCPVSPVDRALFSARTRVVRATRWASLLLRHDRAGHAVSSTAETGESVPPLEPRLGQTATSELARATCFLQQLKSS